MKLAVICLWGGALAAVGCAEAGRGPTSPSAMAGGSVVAATLSDSDETASPSSAAAPRSGALLVTKECSGYTGEAGSFCTITASNVKAIEVDSTILYLQPATLFTPAGSDVVLDVPGPGNNQAFGHCSLATGVCTFSGGTGKFTKFQASVAVSSNEDFSLWYWNGTFSFIPGD